MGGNKTADRLRQDRAWVTAAEWFAGGQRIGYDPGSARVLTGEEGAATPGALRVFERVARAGDDANAVWLTLLPGFPDGSYGWAQVDKILGDDLGPRLYVEPVGQGDSDKPRDYRYSTVERADLVEALWRHHGVRRTVVGPVNALDARLRAFDRQLRAEADDDLDAAQLLIHHHGASGSLLATAGQDGDVRVWDAATHQQVLDAHQREAEDERQAPAPRQKAIARHGAGGEHGARHESQKQRAGRCA